MWNAISLTSLYLFYTAAGGYPSSFLVSAFAPQSTKKSLRRLSSSSCRRTSIRNTWSPVIPTATSTHPTPYASTSLFAGGFEWEDPTDAFDQGVENPFKNPDLVEGDGGMKIDPARLLGPRLQGSNLYLIGMMGSGKSAVGDIVARSEL